MNSKNDFHTKNVIKNAKKIHVIFTVLNFYCNLKMSVEHTIKFFTNRKMNETY